MIVAHRQNPPPPNGWAARWHRLKFRRPLRFCDADIGKPADVGGLNDEYPYTQSDTPSLENFTDCKRAPSESRPFPFFIRCLSTLARLMLKNSR